MENAFFFNDTATTEIYTLSLHDALPISSSLRSARRRRPYSDETSESVSTSPRPIIHSCRKGASPRRISMPAAGRSEEHTSELQSPCNLVCRLLLEKKKPYPAATCCTPSIVDRSVR